MPFTLQCIQCMVTSVLQDQQYNVWCNKFANSRESFVEKERPRMLAASIFFTPGTGIHI